MRNRLQAVTIRGFKSIRNLVGFEPGPLSVLIGPNGAGKSNFISFFRMLSWALGSPVALAEHVARAQGASKLLFGGPQVTRDIEAELRVRTDKGDNDYAFRLAWAAGDTLIFTEEKFRVSWTGSPKSAPWQQLGAGHRESRLPEAAIDGSAATTARVIGSLLRKLVVHQFHNTSDTSRMRQKWSADDCHYLKEDGANLASFLRRLRDDQPRYYARIVDHIRLVLPFFADFELTPDRANTLLLSWRERGSDVVFSASQAADGMLRAMALIALLLQPQEDLPDVVLLDEPELGLHLAAIQMIGGLIRAAAESTQLVVATQSVALVDCFEPEHVVVVDRCEGESWFRRLDAQELGQWLGDYSLSELWEKNVLGGRP